MRATTATGTDVEGIVVLQELAGSGRMGAHVIGTCVAGRFVLEALAGSGGMGAVYRAHDKQIGQTVALKLLRSGGGDHGIERFARESDLLSRLRHPGIVTYLAHG